MGGQLAACNAAWEAFKAEYPEVGNYFCFLAGFNAAMKAEAAPDELTALRERIRALADEWSREDAGLTLNLAANDLRMLLGDA